MISVDNVLNIVIKSIVEENAMLLIMTLSGIFFIWSYNEFRKNYINVKTQNSRDIKNSLEQYSKLYFSIEAFQQQNIKTNELLNYFSKTIVYLPKNIVKEMLKLDKSTLEVKSIELENIKEKIANEIELIKDKQNTVTTFNSKDAIFNRISWSFSNNNFDSFIFPFIYSFFALTGVLSLTTIILGTNNLSGILRIYVFINIINFSCLIILLIYLGDLSNNNMLKAKAYIYFALLAVMPYLFTFVFNIKYSLFNTFTLMLFLYLVKSKKLLKSHIK